MRVADAKAPDGRAVKLSCRHVWKVFGAGGRAYPPDPGDSSAASVDAMRQSGVIPAVVDASFDVHAGEIFVIMGLSGSGKSTLIRCLSRLIEPSAGQVMLDGQDLLAASRSDLVALRRRTMGMVFQSFGLLPHLTVLENVGFPLRMHGNARAKWEARAREMIAQVGLEGREFAYPSQLSGGQQQRVGIARSLAADPELWFLDEPFSALDPLIRRQMQDEFLRLQKMLHKTIVFITHDIAEAFRLADRVAIMRAGRIVQIGRPAEIVLTPADDYVARFVEDTPVLRVIRAADLAEPASGPLPDAEVEADAVLEQVLPRFFDGTAALRIRGEARTLRASRVFDLIRRMPSADAAMAAL
ncbi:MAG: ATP-binding cassette domain-containing protein [Nitratireductor sp.]|nr:ATP-binding cassette domain-containing protein [Nitratireductor sp.]